MHAVRWIHGTGCVFGQGAAGQDGDASALLLPPPAILLEAYQGNHFPNSTGQGLVLQVLQTA